LTLQAEGSNVLVDSTQGWPGTYTVTFTLPGFSTVLHDTQLGGETGGGYRPQ